MIIAGTTSRVTVTAAWKLVSITARKSSSGMPISNWSRVMPALETRTSTAPCWMDTSSTAAFTCAGSVTSHRTAKKPVGGSVLW